MPKKRENYKVVILEPALSRLKRDECPSCGLPRKEYKRTKSWRCCSVKCTERFGKMYIYYGWKELKDKALKRDKYTCVKCNKIPEKRISKVAQHQDYIDFIRKSIKFIREDNLYLYEKDYTQLIGDHIKPIALGGNEWDLKNIQTLCVKCNKIKTRNDSKDIAKLRKSEKMEAVGQITLPSATLQSKGV